MGGEEEGPRAERAGSKEEGREEPRRGNEEPRAEKAKGKEEGREEPRGGNKQQRGCCIKATAEACRCEWPVGQWSEEDHIQKELFVGLDEVEIQIGNIPKYLPILTVIGDDIGGGDPAFLDVLA